MKIKTENLEGAALNWAVAQAVGERRFVIQINFPGWPWVRWGRPRYSTEWEYGGPLIEQHDIELVPSVYGWEAGIGLGEHIHNQGETVLVAAMRALVRSKLGHEVDVPDELNSL